MAYDDIRSRIVTIIEGAADDVGIVHNRDRWANNWTDLLKLFEHEMSDGTGNRVLGWMISRRTVEPDQEGADGSRFGAVHRLYTFQIRGVMGFNDEDDTEGKFNALVDAVIDALDNNINMTGAAAETVPQGAGFTSVGTIELRLFGSVVCHYVEIIFPCVVLHEF